MSGFNYFQYKVPSPPNPNPCVDKPSDSQGNSTSAERSQDIASSSDTGQDSPSQASNHQLTLYTGAGGPAMTNTHANKSADGQDNSTLADHGQRSGGIGIMSDGKSTCSSKSNASSQSTTLGKHGRIPASPEASTKRQLTSKFGALAKPADAFQAQSQAQNASSNPVFGVPCAPRAAASMSAPSAVSSGFGPFRSIPAFDGNQGVRTTNWREHQIKPEPANRIDAIVPGGPEVQVARYVRTARHDAARATVGPLNAVQNIRSSLHVLKGPIIQVLVGSDLTRPNEINEREVWGLPKHLVSNYSGLLAVASSNEHGARAENTVSLPTCNPKVFPLFVEWMYYDAYTAATINNIDSNVQAWILGDQLSSPGFQNYAIRQLYAQVGKKPISPPSIRHAVLYTSSESQLNKLFADVVQCRPGNSFGNSSRCFVQELDNLFEEFPNLRMRLYEGLSSRNRPIKKVVAYLVDEQATQVEC